MNRLFALAALGALISASSLAQNAPEAPGPNGTVPNGPTVPPAMKAGPLSLPLAYKAASAALEACQGIGYPNATAVVVDTGGHTLLVLRSPTAVDPTVEAARRKAYTAVKTGMSSADFGKSKGWAPPARRPANGASPPDEPPLPPGAVRAPTATPGVPSIIYDGDPNLVPMGGGVLITSHSKSVGGIGLSGAMGPVLDEQCSSAGAQAIKDQVE